MRIAPFHFADGGDEVGGWSFRTGLAAMRQGRKQEAVFPIDQRFVELEQRCRFDERADLRHPARAHEQSGQPEHAAIERSQIRGAASRPVTDQDLMLEQQRFCYGGAQATGAHEFQEGDQQVDGEDEEVVHGANRTMTVSARKTAPHR